MTPPAMTPDDPAAPPLLAHATGCAPAPLWMRAVALALDGLLASFAGMLIFFRLVAPQAHPNADEILLHQMQILQEGGFPDPASDPEFADLLLTEVKTLLIVYFVYFAISELAWRGATLGKRVFRLRTARWPLGEQPTWIETITRCLVKSASLLYIWLLLADLLPLCFRPARRCLHDYLARTFVTGDPLPPVEADALADEED